MDNPDYQIFDLSPHLFWDVDKEKLSWERSADYIIEKVALFGSEKDWFIIKSIYGLDQIKKTILTIRSMDEKSLDFYSKLFHIPFSQFRCYTQKQFFQGHMPY